MAYAYNNNLIPFRPFTVPIFTKDADFYFNDEEKYTKACEIIAGNPHVDVCWYEESPHELHDLDFVMCDLSLEGLVIAPRAQVAFNSGVSEINIENVIYADRTRARLLKYNRRYGLRYKLSQIIAFYAIYNFELTDDILECTVNA